MKVKTIQPEWNYTAIYTA